MPGVNQQLANLNLSGYFSQQPTTAAPAARPGAAAAEGPVAPIAAQTLASSFTKTVPAASMGAVGAARALASTGKAVGAVERIVADASRPVLSLGLFGKVAEFGFKLVTFQIGGAFEALGEAGSMIGQGASAAWSKLTAPVTLTAAVSGAERMGPIGAIGAGMKAGVYAIKSSFLWAIPAAAISAFVDYKYRDVSDTKRIASNFAADVVGYTATGMAGAAVGAAIGSMTVPLVGTIVGAVAGIGLGILHDQITRPMLSDTIHDAIG